MNSIVRGFLVVVKNICENGYEKRREHYAITGKEHSWLMKAFNYFDAITCAKLRRIDHPELISEDFRWTDANRWE